MKSKFAHLTIPLTLAGIASTVAISGAAAATVNTETNGASGNAIQIFQQNLQGDLSFIASVSTVGAGTGSGLGDQGALGLSDEGRGLFAANAGSNDVSVFAVAESGLTLVGRTASGGVEPIKATHR